MKPITAQTTDPLLFRVLLRLYPPDFRREFGPAILQLLRDQRRDLAQGTMWGRIRFCWAAITDLSQSALRERASVGAADPPTAPAMIIAVFSALVALALGFGAVQEFVVRGLGNGELEPGALGVVAAIVCALILFAGIAYARRTTYARRLLIVTGVLSLVVHGYGALPPHYVGRLALLMAVVSAGVLISAGLRMPKSQPQ